MAQARLHDDRCVCEETLHALWVMDRHDAGLCIEAYIPPTAGLWWSSWPPACTCWLLGPEMWALVPPTGLAIAHWAPKTHRSIYFQPASWAWEGSGCPLLLPRWRGMVLLKAAGWVGGLTVWDPTRLRNYPDEVGRRNPQCGCWSKRAGGPEGTTGMLAKLATGGSCPPLGRHATPLPDSPKGLVADKLVTGAVYAAMQRSTASSSSVVTLDMADFTDSATRVCTICSATRPLGTPVPGYRWDLFPSLRSLVMTRLKPSLCSRLVCCGLETNEQLHMQISHATCPHHAIECCWPLNC